MPQFKLAGPAPTGEALAQASAAFKAAGNGEVTALFARLNVVDLDGDVTLPGAFDDGAAVVISAYGHRSWNGALPVGKGTIGVKGDAAILAGQFFMTTPHGRDTFETVRELGPLGQWSYGYDTVEPGGHDFGDFGGRQVRFLKRLRVHEVSPTLVGVGVRTMTLSAKDHTDLVAIRAALLGDHDVAEEAAREYARFARHLIGANGE
jgi:hypothetical protein